ncbi:MAG: cyclase family protein [Nitrospiria bacterium]
MKLYDVSRVVSEALPVWPGDPAVEMRLACSLEKGDAANVTELRLSAHSGTHVDAPRHFFPGGDGVDQLPLEALVGLCRVFELLDVKEEIRRADLRGCDLEGVRRVLFKTRNSRRSDCDPQVFEPDYVSFSAEIATDFADGGIRLVGIDGPSIEKFHQSAHPVHHILLRKHVIILENLDLSEVPPGDYELIALPLKLKGADGAPARVILRAF